MQEFLLANAAQAYILVFLLLVIAGLNVPISEDIVVLTGGYLASIYQNDSYTYRMFMAIFFGAFLGDCVVFAIGRYFGPPLLETRLFSKVLTLERRALIESYFKKYGSWTLFGGRFIPFGVRNGLIITAAFSHVRFVLFAISDILALTLTTSFLFWLGFHYASNLAQVVSFVRRGFLGIFIVALLLAGVLLWRAYKKKDTTPPKLPKT